MFLSVWILLGQGAIPQPISQADVLRELKALPGCKVQEIDSKDGKIWELILKQPLDHNKRIKGSFRQHIYLRHKSTFAPVVFVTEGYALRGPRKYELTDLLDANQVRVEYRYFGESMPKAKKGWDYLRNEQAAHDLHRIRELLGKFYHGPWINTGISKGGQTTLIYKRFYPEDVVATVAYVAPMALGLEDPRTDRWQDSIGTDACRADIRAFQRAVLENRAQTLAGWKSYCAKEGHTFSIGVDVAFEYAVLEYPFSFWQMGFDCENIPDENATEKELLAHLLDVVGPDLYTDEGIAAYQSHFYQAMYEQGYYGFPKAHLEELLKAVEEPSNRTFAPKGIEIEFHPEFVPEILNWIDQHGDRILYIYGELDTWTACAVTPNPERDALKLTVAGGSHGVRIKHLSDSQKARAYQKLSQWTGVELK